MQRLERLFDRFPGFAALALGLGAASGFPPLSLWPLAMLSLALFAWLIWRSAGWRGALWRGWLFGVAHFTLTNNWIATAFTYQAEMPAILGWAAVPLLSLYLALFPALAAASAKVAAPRGSLAGFGFALGAGWIASEWLRSWVFTGYAWGPLSLMLLGDYSSSGAAGALPFMGTYALSGLLVVFAAGWGALLLARRWLPAAAMIFGLAAVMLWPAGVREEGTLAFTLVQPNLQQEEMDDASKFEEQFQRIARLSLPDGRSENRLVLWPESGVPDYLEPGYPQRYYDQLTAGGDPDFARARIGNVIGDGSLLLTGAVRLEIGDVLGVKRAVGAYNSVLAIDGSGEITTDYAKAHLVPYGEYLPMRWLLEPLGLSRLVAGSIDFIPGPGPQTLDLGRFGKAGVQICYEIIFSGDVVDPDARPDYIFNPSNDGWFGKFGPPQHLAQARMRALEEGLPVLRATTTGISAVIDADGIVREHIGMNRAERIHSVVPPAKSPTPFALLGHWLTLVWTALLIAASLVARRIARR